MNAAEIERVAKAIYDDERKRGLHHWAADPPWAACRQEAKAALTAYHEYLKERNLKILPREPTLEMMKAFWASGAVQAAVNPDKWEPAMPKAWAAAWDAAQGER